MAWILLFFAGLLEIVWAYSMKLSHGFSRLTPSIVTVIAHAGQLHAAGARDA